MTYLEKLTDLVCQEKDIEKQIKELKFGTEIKVDGIKWKVLSVSENWKIKFIDGKWYIAWDDDNKTDEYNPKIEIIWNPLELHHLIWFCENKKIKFSLQTQFLWNLKQTMLFFNRNWCCKYDNKKPLHQQSEEVLKNIFEALAS